MSKLGPIVIATDVEKAISDTLVAWMPSYLAEVGAQHGKSRTDLPMFRSFTSATSLSKWPEAQLPACIVISPGIIGTPQRLGAGAYRTEWNVGIGAVVSGNNEDSTNLLVRLYTAAMRAAVLQHPSLGDFAAGTRWMDERYDRGPVSRSRTLAVGMISLGVQVDNALDASKGLKTPPADAATDPGDWGQVATASVVTEGP